MDETAGQPGNGTVTRGVGKDGVFDPVCPRCHLIPIVFEYEDAPSCQFCGTRLAGRKQ